MADSFGGMFSNDIFSSDSPAGGLEISDMAPPAAPEGPKFDRSQNVKMDTSFVPDGIADKAPFVQPAIFDSPPDFEAMDAPVGPDRAGVKAPEGPAYQNIPSLAEPQDLGWNNDNNYNYEHHMTLSP